MTKRIRPTLKEYRRIAFEYEIQEAITKFLMQQNKELDASWSQTAGFAFVLAFVTIAYSAIQIANAIKSL